MIKMDNYIELNDELEEYELDEFDCFQRPIGIIIDSLESNSADTFILYSKALEVYTSYNLREIRYNVLDFISELGFEVKKYGKKDICSFMENEIDNNKLIILGIEYNRLFYSKYYKEQNYPHWIIINGYDRRKKTFSIYDYTHFLDENFTFKQFVLNYKYIIELNKKFVDNYGKYDSLFSISKVKQEKSQYEIAVITMNYILSKMKEKKYSVIKIFSEMIYAKNNLENTDLTEYETLVMNLNKSRKLFIVEVIKIMDLYEYDKSKIECMLHLSKKIENEYYSFTSLCIVKIVTNKY